ncbi:MAG: 30S ribosomal protein S19e [Methanoregula sp. PtaU1.Bin051]|nr:MAG: 30S ribosomal protein S19e [Methanoregula sp. PtaU1.Bin051]
MTTVYDVPADLLIRKVAEALKSRQEIKPPAWAAFAKTGVHKEMPPEDPDWWYIRSAAVLRRVYVDGPLGVQRMRTFYGGIKDRGSKPNAFRKGSGSVLRKSLQQLEACKFILKDKAGRKISPEGQAFLDAMAKETLTNPPAPVPKKVQPQKAEPKKAEAGKGDKKPAVKKGEGKKADKAEKPETPKSEKKPEGKKADKAEKKE